MKYVVTGGVGFIGSNLVDRLLKNKHQVIVIDNLESHESRNRLESSELSHWKHNKNLKILFDNLLLYNFLHFYLNIKFSF